MGFELVLDHLGEGSRKQGFAQDWMLSTSGSNSMIGYLKLYQG